ncbi:MAG: hypothetical protein E7557_08490 [Ruminococcaceae bacterium]|nr:hypothetical protein [Oscillospiraceae bacterium]
MEIKLVTDEKIAETSSKGNQEKWFEKENGKWYKVDRMGYEAFSETVISRLLEYSNIKVGTPFTFVNYDIERVKVHSHERNACASDNFLKRGQSIVTVSHLLKQSVSKEYMRKLKNLSSDKKRIEYLAETVKEITSLKNFPEYLALLFEIDALFVNDDRHLNNIAVIEENGEFSYCPVFDNGAGLLSDIFDFPMDIAPLGLLKAVKSRPFNMSFNRQKNIVTELYGQQLDVKKFNRKAIVDITCDLLEFYPERDRGIILDRVTETILYRQKY